VLAAAEAVLAVEQALEPARLIGDERGRRDRIGIGRDPRHRRRSARAGVIVEVPSATLGSPSSIGERTPSSRAMSITASSPTWPNRRTAATLLECAKASASVMLCE
jgi:hypothetical protein